MSFQEPNFYRYMLPKQTNREIFNDLAKNEYFTSTQQAEKIFRDMRAFENALGFDKKSGGFLAIHCRHAPSAFDREIPVCVFLKKSGFRVLLTEELGFAKSADALIDGIPFEIKQIANAKNFARAVIYQFRTAYVKCDNILLHIVQPVKSMQIRGAINNALKIYPSIKLVWLVAGNVLYQLDRSVIIANNYHLD